MSLEFRPGLYEHFKGGVYRALYLARLSEQRNIQVVVYVSLANGHIWVRPWSKPLLEGDDCWTDLVTWPDGTTKPRFIYRGEPEVEDR
jgi:hypothetical protein